LQIGNTQCNIFHCKSPKPFGRFEPSTSKHFGISILNNICDYYHQNNQRERERKSEREARNKETNNKRKTTRSKPPRGRGTLHPVAFIYLAKVQHSVR